MNDKEYGERLELWAERICDSLDKDKKLTLVLGNGVHFVPIVDRDAALRITAGVFLGILPSTILTEVADPIFAPRDAKARLEEALKNPELPAAVNNLTDEEKEAYSWDFYERLRRSTGNRDHRPFTYFPIRYLLDHGKINTVITTNYDLFIDNIIEELEEEKGDRLARNPRLARYEWPCYGYCSPSSGTSTSKPTFWKIHGSLAFFCWPECGCINKVPDKALFLSPPWQRKKTGICWGRHFHDLNDIDRHPFEILTYKVEEHLIATSADTGAIIVLGFKGDYDPSTKMEYLAKILVDMDQKGNPVYLIVAPTKHIVSNGYSYLWNYLEPKGQAIQPPEGNRSLEPADIFCQVLKRMKPHLADFDKAFARETALQERLGILKTS